MLFCAVDALVQIINKTKVVVRKDWRVDDLDDWFAFDLALMKSKTNCLSRR